VYFEYRTIIGKPSILIRVLPKSKVTLAKLGQKNEPTAKDVTSELLMVVEFKGLEYEIRFKCDETSTNIHFDNKKDINQVMMGWNEVNQRLKAHDRITKYGIALHNLMDFYSHSNYVEMYLKYWENDLGKNLKDFSLDDIPHWDDAIAGGFGNSKWYSQIRTGDFQLGVMMKGENTHAEMNKDTRETPKGSEKICDTCVINFYNLARYAAIKHTAKYLK
jgi:hypothetical protein